MTRCGRDADSCQAWVVELDLTGQRSARRQEIMLEKAEGRGKVRFSVFDAESGEPVPGASVGRLAARGDACFSIGYSATQDGKEALVKSRRFLEPLLN